MFPVTIGCGSVDQFMQFAHRLEHAAAPGVSWAVSSTFEVVAECETLEDVQHVLALAGYEEEALEADASTPTIDDARDALDDLQERCGPANLAAAYAVLQRFEVASLRDMKPADFPAFIAACEAA